MKQLFYTLFLSTILFTNCVLGGNIKGKVINAISNKPIVGIVVTGYTTTKIEEDKKFEKISCKTDVNGVFVLKGLPKKYQYKISVSTKGYESQIINARAPEGTQTLLLDSPIIACLSPQENGIFILVNGKWKKLEANFTTTQFDFRKRFDSFSNLIPYYPTNLNLPANILTEFTTNNQITSWINGELTDKDTIGISYEIKTPITICYVGDHYSYYNFSGMYFYSESEFYSEYWIKEKSGTKVNVPEGYYAGMRQMRGRDASYGRIEVNYQKGIDMKLKELCSMKMNNLNLGNLDLPLNGYFIIYEKDNTSSILLKTE